MRDMVKRFSGFIGFLLFFFIYNFGSDDVMVHNHINVILTSM